MVLNVRDMLEIIVCIMSHEFHPFPCFFLLLYFYCEEKGNFHSSSEKVFTLVCVYIGTTVQRDQIPMIQGIN